MVPPLLSHFHKGQLGRLAIVGGCEDYTGAPFFSAHAAMLLGCDLVHVITEEGTAATVIKSYSPDLMVHPYLGNGFNLQKITGVLDRMDAIVIGPGFGRSDAKLIELRAILNYLNTEKRQIPIVLDADALYFLSLGHLNDYINLKTILTPNVVEFARIRDGIDNSMNLQQLSKHFECTIVEKGSIDSICFNGKDVIIVEESGSLKRVGGQGDTLSGLIGCMLAWGMGAYKKGIWEREEPIFTDDELVQLCCLGGAWLARRTGNQAYHKYGRSMLTSNLAEFIPSSWEQLKGDKY